VYLEVQSIIRGTRQFVDDISSRYFQGFHRHLPIISRTRFYNSLIMLGAAPAADFSVLLLTICLITHAPALGYQSGHGATRSVEQQSLYLTAKSLFAQVQVSCSPSVPMIQASLLLAVYEYTHGRPDDAFVTIAGSARMAYAARIHARDRHQAQMAHTTGLNADIDVLLHAEEAANTWWGIVICERYVSPNIPRESSTQMNLRL
jgi:Fungal specific transcription factor domain